MSQASLTAISPIDGRYHNKTKVLDQYFSEYALIRYRACIEVRWLQKLAATETIAELPEFDADTNAFLEQLLSDFSLEDAQQVKDIEKQLTMMSKRLNTF